MNYKINSHKKTSRINYKPELQILIDINIIKIFTNIFLFLELPILT